MKGMTIRQLAKLCGVGQSTIRRWADRASFQLKSIRGILESSQQSKKRALFDLEQTIAIIRAGGIWTRKTLRGDRMNRLKGMTIKQIADLCHVSPSAVRNWIISAESAEISAKTAKARQTSKPALFTLEETIAIVRAGGNALLADLLWENACKNGQLGRASRLPNGRQMEEMRRIFGPMEAGLRLDFILGFSRRERLATPEEVAAAMRGTLTILKSKDQPELPGLGG